MCHWLYDKVQRNQFDFYRPQMNFVKVMFLHVSVILSTGESEAGTPSRDQTPPQGPGTPWDQAPPRTRHPRDQASPWHQAPPPRADTSQDQAPPKGVYAGRYGQQAGGMHHTGMQSCFSSLSLSVNGPLVRLTRKWSNLLRGVWCINFPSSDLINIPFAVNIMGMNYIEEIQFGQWNDEIWSTTTPLCSKGWFTLTESDCETKELFHLCRLQDNETNGTSCL